MPPKSGRREYDFVQQLGRGAFGVVHKVLRKSDGQAFVCKEVNLRGLRSSARERAEQEVFLLKKISDGSEFIVQYEGSFLDREVLHIIMEFCAHGDLSAHIRQLGGKLLEENTVWKYLLQVGLGLKWLHFNRILHRDMKTLNVFLTASNDARLGDLGVACLLCETQNFASTLVGTPYYLSPELCENRPYNDRSDVWAYGCIVYEMCTGKPPFHAKNQAALLAKIIQGRYPAVPKAYSEELRTIIDACLVHEFMLRPDIETLLSGDAPAKKAEELGLPSVRPVAPAPLGADQEASFARWRRRAKQASKLHEEATKDLDVEGLLAWDGLYRMLKAKMMVEDLSEHDHSEIETHIFQELPVEQTHLISKALRILQLEKECESYQEVLGTTLCPAMHFTGFGGSDAGWTDASPGSAGAGSFSGSPLSLRASSPGGSPSAGQARKDARSLSPKLRTDGVRKK